MTAEVHAACNMCSWRVESSTPWTVGQFQLGGGAWGAGQLQFFRPPQPTAEERDRRQEESIVEESSRNQLVADAYVFRSLVAAQCLLDRRYSSCTETYRVAHRKCFPPAAAGLAARFFSDLDCTTEFVGNVFADSLGTCGAGLAVTESARAYSH